MVSEADADVQEMIPKVERVMGQSDMADIVIAKATIIDRNLKLVRAMNEHNTDFTDLYRDVVEYIPSFYRINSLAAVSNGEVGATVTMSGVLQTSQQYADLMVALYRIPNINSVSRVGFTASDPYVPSIIESDQFGTPINPGEANLPSDPEQRMAAMIQRASGSTSGFQNVSNFGSEVNPKGPMPGWSVVTVTLVIGNVDIRTPNPKATIDQQTAGGAGTGGPGAPGAGGTPGFGRG